MIRAVKGGFVVVSEKTGKRLSRVYAKKADAELRLSRLPEHFITTV